MDSVTGIHTYWTPPQFNDLKLEYFHDNINHIRAKVLGKYTAILSVLWWKRLNGDVFKLYTDSIGLSEYKDIGIDEIYDIIDVDTLDAYDISPKLWTAGKIYSLTREDIPFCFIDNDLILRDKLTSSLLACDVGFTHWELPFGQEYNLDTDVLYSKGLRLNIKLDLNRLVTNTSLFYINNRGFQEKLYELHKEFFKLEDSDITIPVWMFSDQVIPGQIIRNLGLSYFTIDDKIFLPNSSKLVNDYNYFTDSANFNINDRIDETPNWIIPHNHSFNSIRTGHDYEHLWIFKKHIISNDSMFDDIIYRYKCEIKREFPKYYYLCK
jgi:hypothetical protein